MESQRDYVERLNRELDRYCFVRNLEREAERMEKESEDIFFFFFCAIMLTIGFCSDRIAIYLYNILQTLTQ